MLRFSREDLISGRVRWTDLTPAEWRDRDERAVAEIKATGAFQPFQKEYFRKDGSRIPVMIGGAMFEESGSEVVAFVLDLNEQKQAEEALRKAQTELAHVTRVTTLGEMTASIAHEINQPLGAILTNTETARLMLQSPSPDLGEMREILTDIWRDNRRASEVVRRLRSFVSKAPFQRQEFDLNDVVVESVKFLSAQARSREITMRIEPTRMPLRINGDPIQLQQVISNVILNAMDAALDTLRAQRVVTVTTTQDRRFAEICVEDTGPGVPPESATKIFEPFFSTKNHGMGMGLSIARTIVKAHDGQIGVENRNGAVFRIRLPLIA